MGSGSLSARIAVVGTGVIGASWAAYFLAKGFDVPATDPADGAERRLRTLVDGFWPALERVGLAEGASRTRLHFDPDIRRARRLTPPWRSSSAKSRTACSSPSR